MRPRNEIARVQLDRLLRTQGPISAAELARRAGVSVPTVLRVIQSWEGDVLRFGVTKHARYAMRRPLRGSHAPIPVYRVNAQGQGVAGALLHLLSPTGTFFSMEGLHFPIAREFASGIWEGLPYPLYDMRPQGYLGRMFARRAAQDLDVPNDPEYWSDDHITYVLSRRGADTSGHLIIGDEAYSLWLQSVSMPEMPIPEPQQEAHYAQLAEEAVAFVGMGSSAGGEFPKFTAQRQLAGSATSHVIVKFSGADDSSSVRRWSDLLVCEHLALEVIRSLLPVRAAQGRILQSGSRTFLEVERFDRRGEWGRLPLVSLSSLDAALIGRGSGAWPELVEQLVKAGMVETGAVYGSQVLWWFGRLIANSDMHLGNLSFQYDPDGNDRAIFYLAPAYDMLPMLYAPLSGGEVPPRQFVPELPLPREAEAWKQAYAAALAFWDAVSHDSRVSMPFRQIGQQNLTQLQRVRPAVL